MWFSRNAEKELIRELLDSEFFSAPGTQRRLAFYPYANTREKADLVCELMQSLWSLSASIEVFPVFRDFDLFLVASGKRGHFIHQFEVFLLGLRFIQSFLEETNGPKPRFLYSNPYRVFVTWLMTATAHDFGRPLEIADLIAGKLSDLYKGLGMHELSNQYKRLPEKNLLQGENKLNRVNVDGQGHDHLQTVLCIDSLISKCVKDSLGVSSNESERITETLRKEDNHGYVSAAVLCRSAILSLLTDKSINQIKKSWIFGSLRKAMGAIALHALHNVEDGDISRSTEQISFNLNPYAYLLFLVDNIQDWSRPFANIQDWPTYELTHFSSAGKKIRLDYVLTFENWTTAKKDQTRESLRTRKELILTAQKPIPPFGVELIVTFESNEADEFEEIRIDL